MPSIPSPIIETPRSNDAVNDDSSSPDETPNNQQLALLQHPFPAYNNTQSNAFQTHFNNSSTSGINAGFDPLDPLSFTMMNGNSADGHQPPLSPVSQFMNFDSSSNSNSTSNSNNALLTSPSSSALQQQLWNNNPTNFLSNFPPSSNDDFPNHNQDTNTFSFDSPPPQHLQPYQPQQIANEPYVFSPSAFQLPSPPSFPSLLEAPPPPSPPSDVPPEEGGGSQQRSASEIAADVDALHASIGALVEGLGMDQVQNQNRQQQQQQEQLQGGRASEAASPFDLERFLKGLPPVAGGGGGAGEAGGLEQASGIAAWDGDSEAGTDGMDGFLSGDGQGGDGSGGLVTAAAARKGKKRKSGEGIENAGLISSSLDSQAQGEGGLVGLMGGEGEEEVDGRMGGRKKRG
jgi:hypothetical protein